MRGRAAQGAFAIGCTALVAICVTACNSSILGNDGSGLRIVEQVQINQNGDSVPAAADPTAPADPAGNGEAICLPLSIAVAGPLTGPDAAPGMNIKNGAQLAVDQHNAANPGCQVQLKSFDTQGNPEMAADIAGQIVRDVYTIGVIGPTLSAETAATGAMYSDAGIVAATASATSVALSDNGWKTFFRGLANDGMQGIAVANYMMKQLGSTKVCVVDDGTDYGVGLALAVRETLGRVADSECDISVASGAEDFSGEVQQISTRSPDAVFFAGYYAESAPFVRELRDAGVTADFVSADGSKDPEFIEKAGDASKDAVLSCPCGPAEAGFAEAYNEQFGQAPGTFSAGAYDLATIYLRGIDSGAITRPELLDYVRNYNGQGLERKYQWTEIGELTSTLIWIYKVQ